jgi:hypothetical protein
MEHLIDELRFLIFGQSIPVKSALLSESFHAWAVSFNRTFHVRRRRQQPLDGLTPCLRRKLIKRLQDLVFVYSNCWHGLRSSFDDAMVSANIVVDTGTYDASPLFFTIVTGDDVLVPHDSPLTTE